MKTRNYGIDFLRMISMIMIVMLHTLGHGGILRSVSFLSVHYQIAWLLEVIAFGAVNTYAMISGFVSVDSHFKISNILILWLQVLFYGILINTVFFFLLPESRNTSGWIQALSGHPKRILVFYCLCRSVFSLPIHQSDVSESLRKADKNFILFYSCRIFCGSDHFTDFYTAAGCFLYGRRIQCFLAHTDVPSRCVHQKTESGLSL